MGFPRRCDNNVGGSRAIDTVVSIPYGFSKALRHIHTYYLIRAETFCFNPLWVFQGAATGGMLLNVPTPPSFNPLWVFQGAATLCTNFTNGLTPCFNPLWVFQGAATRLLDAYWNMGFAFQSLMGFPRRCDNFASGQPSEL